MFQDVPCPSLGFWSRGGASITEGVWRGCCGKGRISVLPRLPWRNAGQSGLSSLSGFYHSVMLVVNRVGAGRLSAYRPPSPPYFPAALGPDSPAGA